MRVRFPLLVKIPLLLLFNFGMIALGFMAFPDRDSAPKSESAPIDEIGDRLKSICFRIRDELNRTPTGEWSRTLGGFNRDFAMQFLLFDTQGKRVAGKAVDLPDVVSARLRDWAGVGAGATPATERFDKIGSSDGAPITTDREMILPEPMFFRSTPGSPGHWFGMWLPSVRNDFHQPASLFLLAAFDDLGLSGVKGARSSRWKTGLIIILVTLAIWIPFARGLTRSVEQLTEATESIASGQFDLEVKDTRADELGQLGEAINKVAKQLTGFMSGQKRFLGDTAHELCSPLARMQMAVGVLDDRVNEKHIPYLNDIREEVTHMSDLVNELLSFSKASLRPEEIRFESIRLKPVVEKCVAREAHGKVKIKVEIEDDLTVSVNRELMARAIGNLLRNAVRYAGKSGPIGVKAVKKDDHVIVSVWDSGAGIDEKDLERVFDPFYRPDLSRTSKTGGVGLGLVIVKTCIEACGGAVKCRNRKSGGLKVLIKLNGDYDTLVTGFDTTGAD